jgi:hypothetical protein
LQLKWLGPRSGVLALAAVTLSGTAKSQAVRDSAGIRIVDNARPLLNPAKAWRIEPTPILAIGGAGTDADTLNELNLVMGVTQLSDGRWAVGVQGSSTVRFYDSRGRMTGSAGRKGEGPGEFRQVMGVRAMRGDTLVVTDLGEVEWFTADGKFVRQGASRSRGDVFVYPAVVLGDGSYLGQLYDERTVVPAGRVRQRNRLVIVGREGSLRDTVGSIGMLEQVFDGRSSFGQQQVVFSAGEPLAADDGRYFIGSATRFEIAEFTLTGKPARLIRLPGRATPVTAEAIRAYREHFQNMPGEDGRPMGPAMKARFAQALERTVYAEDFPPFGRLMLDRAGHLWVQRYSYQSVFMTPGPVRTQTMPVASRWEVFDRAGSWLCTVTLPERFTPVEIGEDYVAGVARDEDDVEQVRAYRLRKP